MKNGRGRKKKKGEKSVEKGERRKKKDGRKNEKKKCSHA